MRIDASSLDRIATARPASHAVVFGPIVPVAAASIAVYRPATLNQINDTELSALLPREIEAA